ncbi:MAG: cysteine desulfurase family protein [Planctomycetaceae bacterium]
MYPIYLDFNRTTPMAPSVLESMRSYWTHHFLLPGQEHPQARAVAESLEYARESIAAMVGCEAFEIVFTGGGTESNNLAILGVAHPDRPGHIVASSLEHESVCNTIARLQRLGWKVDTVPPDVDGTIDPQRIKEALRDDTQLVCLQAANPVLGTLQPVREVADLCHSRGVPVHCDATQAFGKQSVDVGKLRADTVAISGHKFYGPKGTGALYVRRGYPLSPILFGESREMGLRPGAENVPGWIGLGAAASLANRCCDEAGTAMTKLRDHLADALRSVIDPAPIILCEASPRLSNTLTIELPAEARQVQKTARELIFATAMSASPADEMTRCLRAIGRTEYQIGRVVRISIGWTTSREQIDRSVELFAEAVEAAAGFC